MAYRRSATRRGGARPTRGYSRSAPRRSARSSARKAPRRKAKSTRAAPRQQTLRIVLEHATPNVAARVAGAGTVTRRTNRSTF